MKRSESSLPTYGKFAELRLAQFASRDDIVELRDWAFLGHRWVGEAIGFSEWLRLEHSPDELGALALDFVELPASVCDAVCDRIGLPLEGGMALSDLRRLVGDPVRETNFVADQVSYAFVVGKTDVYNLSCTVHRDHGLVYVVMTVPLPPRRSDS